MTHSDGHQKDDRDGESEEQAPDGQLEGIVNEEENRGEQVEHKDRDVVTPRHWRIVAFELCSAARRARLLGARYGEPRKSHLLTLNVHVSGLLEARGDCFTDVADMPQEHRGQRARQQRERDAV